MRYMKIVFTGGGTLGSVSPLIAVAEQLKTYDERFKFLWIGTKTGPERTLVKSYNIPFASIPSGKLRRYLSFKNITDIGRVILGCFAAAILLIKFRPRLIIGAGSFIQVPVIYAAKIVCRKSIIIIHQQDIKKGLANHLCCRFADLITISTENSYRDFPNSKTILTGNPFNKNRFAFDAGKSFKMLRLDVNLPVVLVIGGGTGAHSLNELIAGCTPHLIKYCQIIHITGKGKTVNNTFPARYHQYEFLTHEIGAAYTVSDVIVSRAGFATLTELSYLAKPCILIPIKDTHQEDNAQFFKDKDAAVVLSGDKLKSQDLCKEILSLLNDRERRLMLSLNISKIMPKDSTERFMREIGKLIDQKIEHKKWF